MTKQKANLFQEMKFQIEFPFSCLQILNNGNCRICGHCQPITTVEDIKALQSHYSTKHKVTAEGPNQTVNYKMLYQEYDSVSFAGKCTFKCL